MELRDFEEKLILRLRSLKGERRRVTLEINQSGEVEALTSITITRKEVFKRKERKENERMAH